MSERERERDEEREREREREGGREGGREESARLFVILDSTEDPLLVNFCIFFSTHQTLNIYIPSNNLYDS